MTTFEEQFPSFRSKCAVSQGECKALDCNKNTYCEDQIRELCLDKQKVRYVEELLIEQSNWWADKQDIEQIKKDIKTIFKKELRL